MYQGTLQPPSFSPPYSAATTIRSVEELITHADIGSDMKRAWVEVRLRREKNSLMMEVGIAR
jgi:hypothetical protein